MAFVDEAVIRVTSGGGGNGCVSFRREKYIPKGGPDGGNGGRGGSVWFKASEDKTSLLDFRFQPQFEGKRGEHGKGSDKDGRSGEDLILLVPVGTLIYDAGTGELLCDLATNDAEYEVCPGGRGGKGNRVFKSSTRRAPRIATPGEPGKTREVKLELRLLADVGLVGLPNAGKSSFLSVVSHARPKIADYPFTTLFPGLGVVDHNGATFVVADLPGLIEGAASGAGLGHRFLRHVTRTRLLLHFVDVSAAPAEIQKSVQTVRHELHAYDPALSERQQRLVFTKCDLLNPGALSRKKKALEARDLRGFFISSHSGQGMKELLDFLAHETSQIDSEPNVTRLETTVEAQPTAH